MFKKKKKVGLEITQRLYLEKKRLFPLLVALTWVNTKEQGATHNTQRAGYVAGRSSDPFSSVRAHTRGAGARGTTWMSVCAAHRGTCAFQDRTQ